MAKHMIRLFFEPPVGDAESAIDNWVTNFTEWKSDPVEHTLTQRNTEYDGSGTEYVAGSYRFYQSDDKVALLDDFENRLQSIQGGLWYRIGYHICDHDEDDRGGCSWDDKRENGTIPSDIPNLS
jgi:hypothetical protein